MALKGHTTTVWNNIISHPLAVCQWIFFIFGGTLPSFFALFTEIRACRARFRFDSCAIPRIPVFILYFPGFHAPVFLDFAFAL